MSQFKEASDTIKRFAVMFKPLIELGDKLELIDSVENHAMELDNQKVNLLKDIDDLKVKQDAAIKALVEAQDQAAAVIGNAEVMAKATMDNAKAKVNADMASAADAAAKMRLQFNADSKNCADQIETLNKAIGELKLQASLEQGRLDSIKKEIEKIKSL